MSDIAIYCTANSDLITNPYTGVEYFPANGAYFAAPEDWTVFNASTEDVTEASYDFYTNDSISDADKIELLDSLTFASSRDDYDTGLGCFLKRHGYKWENVGEMVGFAYIPELDAFLVHALTYLDEHGCRDLYTGWCISRSVLANTEHHQRYWRYFKDAVSEQEVAAMLDYAEHYGETQPQQTVDCYFCDGTATVVEPDGDPDGDVVECPNCGKRYVLAPSGEVYTYA